MIKVIHVSCVMISFIGFFIRGIWMMRESNMLTRKWVRIIPHIVDTGLLISAILLAIQIQQYPLVHGWVTAKVLGLLVYIALGVVALHRGKTKKGRILAFGGANLVFFYIVAVAATHSPFLLTNQ